MKKIPFPATPAAQSFILTAGVLGSILALGAAHAKVRKRLPTRPPTSASTGGTPVLVELFTSEGCSSCPPADALLARIASEAPALRGDVIVLSEHVTYWNYLGWSDPYATKIATDRQNDYARRFGIDGPYSPEMVVDVRIEFVGSDRDALRQAITMEAGTSRSALSLSLAAPARSAGDTGSLRVHLEAAAVPPRARLLVVLVQREGLQQVARGENGGRVLRHVGIARDFQQVVLPAAGQPLEAEATLRLPHDANDYRVVAFLQEGAGGPILASASTP